MNLFRTKLIYLLYVLSKTLVTIWRAPISYSQFKEDLELRQFLPESTGYYLDIGAGRPVIGSNTYYFYRLGWSGVSVDPIWLNSFLHKIFRPRDNFFQALAGPKIKIETVHEFFPYEYTTMQSEVAKQLIASGTARLISTQKINCFPPSTFIQEMDPVQPTLVCIDAEGSDFSILRAIDFSVVRPRAICVESFTGSTETTEIKKFLEKFGYELKSKAGHSLIFVHQSYRPEADFQ